MTLPPLVLPFEFYQRRESFIKIYNELIFFVPRKNNFLFSRCFNFCIFVESTNFKIWDIKRGLKRGLHLVLSLPKNERFFLKILPMSVFVSCSSFMTTWFSIQDIFQNITYIVKNIMTSQSYWNIKFWLDFSFYSKIVLQN